MVQAFFSCDVSFSKNGTLHGKRACTIFFLILAEFGKIHQIPIKFGFGANFLIKKLKMVQASAALSGHPEVQNLWKRAGGEREEDDAFRPFNLVT